MSTGIIILLISLVVRDEIGSLAVGGESGAPLPVVTHHQLRLSNSVGDVATSMTGRHPARVG